MEPMKRVKFLASTIVAEVAPELGLEVHIEPKYGYVGQIKTKDGRYFYFRNTSFDLNGQGSSDNAKDKGYASYFMKRLGYPVPIGKAFYSDKWVKITKSKQNIKEACKYAQNLGYPLIVKPNSKSQGVGIEKVYTEKDLISALRVVFNDVKDHVAIVQRFIEGSDYRIVTLDKEIIAAYRRLPLSVVGDGVKSIRQLLESKQKQFSKIGRDTIIKLDDPRITRKMKRLRLNYDTVVGKNEVVQLLDNANLSTGGDAEDVTEIMHQSYKAMAIKLAHDMGLRYSGIDIITKSPIEESIRDYFVIEINAAAGLDYYVGLGEKQNELVREMYKKVLTTMTK